MAVVTVARMGKDCREAGWTDARRFFVLISPRDNARARAAKAVPLYNLNFI